MIVDSLRNYAVGEKESIERAFWCYQKKGGFNINS